MTTNPFVTLLARQTNDQKLVEDALTLLESSLRERCLLSLADWAQLEVTNQQWLSRAPDFFQAVNALQHPSWGAWTQFFSALRKMVFTVQQQGDDQLQARLDQLSELPRTFAWLDQSLEAEVIDGLRPLYRMAGSRPQHRPSMGQVLGLAVALRNSKSHDGVTADWWQNAAKALRPLIALHARPSSKTVDLDDRLPSPWFIQLENQIWSFNGFERNRVRYAARFGGAIRDKDHVQEIIHGFQQLLGKAEVQDRDFRKLIASVAPEEIKGALFGDDYLLSKPLGEGAHAVVHYGRQLSTGRPVAIKVLRDEHLEEHQERFQQEADHLALIDHPNVVKVLGRANATWRAPREYSLSQEPWFQSFTGSEPIKSFIALELVTGETLEQTYQSRNGINDISRVAEWFAQSAEALAAVHSKGLIHRDVKPSNIMVTDDQQIKLMDFGIARSQNELRELRTGTGMLLGTIPYASPEQLQSMGGENGLSPSSDIYSLCATFYELFTGARLFQHDKLDPIAIAETKIAGHKPTAPQKLNPELPREIEIILMAGLEAEPDDRYPNMEAMAADLRRFLASEPIERAPLPLRRRAQLFYKRQRSLVKAVTALLSLTVVVAVVLLIFLSIERDRSGSLKDKAEEKAKEAKASDLRKYRIKYVADMREAPDLWAATEIDRLLELLHQHHPEKLEGEKKNIPGFEWHYWWRRCHSAQRSWKVKNVITSLSLSHDAKLIAGRDRTGAVHLWNAETTKRETTLPLSAVMVAFSPTEPVLAVNLQSGRVVLYDVANGKCAQRWKWENQRLRFNHIAFSANGRYLAAADVTLPTPRLPIWKVSSGELVHQAAFAKANRRPDSPLVPVRSHRGPALCVAFSPDGKLLASGGADGNVMVWDMESGKLRSALSDHNGPVISIAFSPTGKLLATGSSSSKPEMKNGLPKLSKAAGNVIVWDLSTGKARAKLKRHSDRLLPGKTGADYPLLFSPDSKTLIATGERALKVWQLDADNKPTVFKGHTDEVLSIARAPAGHRIVSSSEDRTIRIWQLSQPEEEPLKLETSILGDRASVRPDGKLLIPLGWKGAQLWDPSTKQNETTIPLRNVRYSADGRVYVGCAMNGTVQIFRGQNNAPHRTIQIHQSSNENDLSWKVGAALLALNNDGRFLATCIKRRVIQIWSTKTGKEVARFTHHVPTWSTSEQQLNDMAFSPDGKTLATVGKAGRLLLWKLNGSKVDKTEIKAHRSAIHQVVLSPDGSLVACAGEDRSITLWDPKDGALVATLRGHDRPVTCIAFSADGRRLVSGGGSAQGGRAEIPGHVKLWDVVTKEEVLSVEAFSSKGVQDVVFTPDGAYLAAIGYPSHASRNQKPTAECIIRLWTKLPPTSVLPHHPRPQPVISTEVLKPGPIMHTDQRGLKAIAFSPDGRHMVTAGENDDALILWDWDTRQIIRRFKGSITAVDQLSFSPNGKRLLGQKSANGIQPATWQVWDVQTGNLLLTLNRNGQQSPSHPTGKPLPRRSASLPALVRLGFSPSTNNIVGVRAILGKPPGPPPIASKVGVPVGGWGKKHTKAPPDLWITDLETLKTVASIYDCPEILRSVHFSSNYRLLLTFGQFLSRQPPSLVHRARIWSTQTGKQLSSFSTSVTASDFVFSPDGKFVAVLEMGGKPPGFHEPLTKWMDQRRDAVLIYECKTGKKIWRLEPQSLLHNMAFSPNGMMLALAQQDQKVTLWDVRTGLKLASCSGHTDGAQAVAFTPDGKNVASVSADGTARLWPSPTLPDLPDPPPVEKKPVVVPKPTPKVPKPSPDPPPAKSLLNRKGHLMGKGTWAKVGNQLEMKTKNQALHLFFGDPNWTDYDFSCTVRKLGGANGVSLLFRGNDLRTITFFKVGIFRNRYASLETRFNGKHRGPFQRSKNKMPVRSRKKGFMHPGKIYQVRVEVRGKTVQCYLDNTKLFTWTGLASPKGRVGIHALKNTQIQVSNIKVTSPDGKILWEGLPDIPN